VTTNGRTDRESRATSHRSDRRVPSRSVASHGRVDPVSTQKNVTAPAARRAQTGLEVARLAVAAGAQALHVSAYAELRRRGRASPTRTRRTNPGALVDLAAAVKATVDVPVITFGRLEPDAADARDLRTGKPTSLRSVASCSPIPICRANLPRTAFDDIRPCIYALPVHRQHLPQPIRRLRGQRVDRARVPSRECSPVIGGVLVVGGGPAGLEAARLLAAAGHPRDAVGVGSPRSVGVCNSRARSDETLDRLLGWLRRASIALV